MSSHEGSILLFEDNRGVYIPRDFAEEMNHSKFTGYTWEDVQFLRDVGNADPTEVGPIDDVQQTYWDIWDKILNNAEFIDSDGYTWHLEQDMDVWLVCPALQQEAKRRQQELELETAKEEVMDAVEGHTKYWIEENVPSGEPVWFIMENREGWRFHVSISIEKTEEDE